MDGVEEVSTGRGRVLSEGERTDIGRTRPAEKAKRYRAMEERVSIGSKGRGAGSKGTQQVENLVMNGDQENMRAMKGEEEEEGHKEDVRKLA